MKPVRPLVAVCCAIAAVTIFSSSASAVPIHKHLVVQRVVGHDPDGPIKAAQEIVRVVDVAPPDSDDDGCPDSADAYNGPGCNAPPPPPPDPAPVTTTTVASSGACPASLAGESTSPTAVNASSGAAGCIQALPSTWAAYGDPAYASAADAPVSVQLEAMARICAAQGNDAWVAADPCG